MTSSKSVLLLQLQLLVFVSIANGTLLVWRFALTDFNNEIEEDLTREFEDHWKHYNESNIHHRQKRAVPYDESKHRFLQDSANLRGHTTVQWVEEAIEMHNELRKLHGVGEVTLDYELTKTAQQWVIKLGGLSYAQQRVVLKYELPIVHNSAQNLGGRKLGTAEQLKSLPGSFPVRVWYSEIKKHNWDKNYFQYDTGHFTQVIWGATKSVGCARHITEVDKETDQCKGGVWAKQPVLTVVCKYDPNGNWLSQNAFNSHVRKPLSGDPNTEPDYKTLCPKWADPCDYPIGCCTPINQPVPFVNPCTPKGRSFATNSTKGRSISKPTNSKISSTPKSKVRVKALIHSEEK